MQSQNLFYVLYYITYNLIRKIFQNVVCYFFSLSMQFRANMYANVLAKT